MEFSTHKKTRTAAVKRSGFPYPDPDAGEAGEGSRREAPDGADSGEVFGDGEAGEGDGAEEEVAGFVMGADLESVCSGVAVLVEVGDEGSDPVDALAEGDDGGLFELNR